MTAWTREPPEAGKRYWLTKRYADGSFSVPWQANAVGGGYVYVTENNSVLWIVLERDHHLRSVDPIVPPPLPEGEVVP